jgi:anaerobic selenocysteine-containing dehydrogenase
MRETGSITRRSFLVGAAAFGAVATLAGCTDTALKDSGAKQGAAQTPKNEVVRHAFCQMCGPARTHCSTTCYINDGVWTNVEGNPDAGNNWGRGSRTLCAKGNSAMQTIYSPLRITHPMKRTGAKGEGKFERITWDEALDIIAKTLKEQKEKYGPESYGVLSPQFYMVLATFGRRFLNVHGSPNYLHSAICNSQRVFSRLVTLGGANHDSANGTDPGQLDKTKLLVVWGYNSENSAVNQGNPNARLNAIEKGLKVIDIRPMRNGLGAHADIWVPVRPGCDCALALAILHVIINERLYDEEFCANWCNGFDELAAHVQQYTPEWAAGITGLPVSQILEVARLMGATKPMAIMAGNGVGDQQNDGHDVLAAICIIEAITGNIGIPGGAGARMVMPKPLIPTEEIDILAERLPKSPEDEANGYAAGVSNLVAPETPRWFQNEITWESGPTTAYFKGLMSTIDGNPKPLRAVFGQSSNPFGATRQPKKIAEALKALDFYFVMDVYWNSSCDYADIVLPACSNYETDVQFAKKNSPQGTWIGINQKIQEPLGESRSDWQFYLDLAVRMGYGKDFWNGDMDACVREQLAPSGISLEELRAADHGIFIERTSGEKPTEPKYQDYEALFKNLPGGKVQCSNDWIGGKPNAQGNAMLNHLPTYKGPAESLSKTPGLAEEYPLILSDVHAYRLCEHSYYVDVPYLRELQPYPWAKINPQTAKKYGINDGDWIKVESPHGWVKLVAEYFEAISPETLMCRRGWWQECEELGLEGYGCFDGGSDVSVLYDSDPANFDQFHSAMSKQTLVRISKLEGAGNVR